MLYQDCELDALHFPKKEMFDPATLKCSMKQLQGLSYKAFVSAAPKVFEATYWKIRSPDQYGQRVWQDIQKMASELRKGDRCEFSKFVKTANDLAKNQSLSL